MNEMAILAKFDAVEITNESRISGEELAFCSSQQALYEKVLSQHRYAFEQLQQLQNACESFLKSVANDNEYRIDSYTHHRYSLDYKNISKEAFAKETIGGVHKSFISAIIGYFTKKYSVTIDLPQYELLLGLEMPESPNCHLYSFSNASDEEIQAMREEQRSYNNAMDVYFSAIIDAKLDYNTLLDHIFVQLNGSSFSERVEQEIKDASRDASRTRWGNAIYELKNKHISFDLLRPRKTWSNEYEVELRGANYLAILRALTYFDSEKSQTEIYRRWLRYTGYKNYESEGIFDLHNVDGAKVLTFKYFKNGRFDVGFDSHVSAKQFASDYLSDIEVGNDD